MKLQEYKNLQVGDIVLHNLTPWKKFIIVSVKEHDYKEKPIFWICDTNSGIPSVHLMSTPEEWTLFSVVKKRKVIAE